MRCDESVRWGLNIEYMEGIESLDTEISLKKHLKSANTRGKTKKFQTI